MFSNIRQQSLFYILEKGENAKVKIGQVESVSNPTPKYNTSFTPSYNPVEMVVDVKVRLDDESLEFKQLPSNMSIYNYNQNGVVVSDSKEAINSEIEAMLKNSQKHIDDTPYHERNVENCKEMLKMLNPQFAKEEEQQKRIGDIESKMNSIESSINRIQDMLMGFANKSKTSKTE